MGDPIPETVARCEERSSPQRVDIPREPEPRVNETSDAVGGGGAGGVLSMAEVLLLGLAIKARFRCKKIATKPDAHSWSVEHDFLNGAETALKLCGRSLPDIVRHCQAARRSLTTLTVSDFRGWGGAVGGRDGASERSRAKMATAELRHGGPKDKL